MNQNVSLLIIVICMLAAERGLTTLIQIHPQPLDFNGSARPQSAPA